MKRWLAFLLAGILLMTVSTACTAKSSISSAPEESSSLEYSSEQEYDPEKDTLIRGGTDENTDQEGQYQTENDQGLEEAVEITEKEAKDLALSEAMRAADQVNLEVDQTSVRVADQDEEAYYVSVDCYEPAEKEYTENPDNSQIKSGTNVYRIDKFSREVSYYG